MITSLIRELLERGPLMSAAVSKKELIDLKEIVMVYEHHYAEMKISHRSAMQQRLWDLFDLGSLEQRLPYT